ncbi:uncharacterized protein LOC143613776 [Bidens hawaiensis]|uniref:uncharacterized protein LOC143613776 n=1 Tax=Bidens hawaiensis TaxID=980011 RepID=UPI00404B4D43
MRRAKTIALQRKDGDHTKQYTHLRSYIDELLKANPSSTIKLNVEPCANPNLKTRQFRRIYVCYAALVKGFKLLGRELLGMDGCFMKGKYPGQILTAVGTNGNNCLYPVAFAIVEAECTDSWKWFLDLLRDDLDLPHDANFTFISDRQKRVFDHEDCDCEEDASHCKGTINTASNKTWDEIQTEASKLTVMMVDDVTYQVKSLRSQCVVNVGDRTCTCRRWDFTGMPCKHVVAALYNMIENNMYIGPLEKWVDEAYWLDTWKKVYNHQIRPIPGPDMWTPSNCPTIITPPKHHTQIGRPKKSRKKALGEKKKLAASKKRKRKIEEVQEVFSAGGRLTRLGHEKSCGRCGGYGHNIRTCRAPIQQ